MRKVLGLIATLALTMSCSGDLGDGDSSSSGESTGSGSSGSGTGGGASSISGSGTSSSSSSSSSTSTGTGMVPDNPMFETDIIPILESSCGAGDKDCHRREAYGANAAEDCRGWATLENADLGEVYYGGPNQGQPTGCPTMGLYDRLTTIPGWTCGPPFASGEITYLVVPCDPDASMIIQKIERPESQQCINGMGEPGQQMPVGAEMDPIELETLRKWIANGAPSTDNPNPDCSG